MSKEKSKKDKEVDVKETVLPDEVAGTVPAAKSNDVLDAVVETQEKVAADMAERIEDLAGRDSAGQIYDETIHATGRDGEPSMTSTGKFRLRKHRKEVDTDEDLQRKSVSETSAALFIQVGVTAFGDEWLPDEKTKEIDSLVMAFDNYYKAAGIRYIPPSLGLVIALGGYSLTRLRKPNTKEKLTALREKITNRFFNIFRRKKQ